MSKSKLKKFHSIDNMNHVIQPSRQELLSNISQLKGNWHKWFNNNNPIILELGCGKGEYSIGLSRLNPHANYIGIDIKGSRIYSGAKIVDEEKLNNVAFLRMQIEYLDYAFDENEISEIWITFPDPQIKFNRRSKRLTSPLMLAKYKFLLQNKGVVHLKTDSLFLYGYTLGLLERKSYCIIKSIHDVHGIFHSDPRLDIKTYYESIFLKKNQPITYLSFSFVH
tara:strand:+ start:691 stop:1359 length:669 start_codon:yes stop_codon:yes gene_type:complete